MGAQPRIPETRDVGCTRRLANPRSVAERFVAGVNIAGESLLVGDPLQQGGEMLALLLRERGEQLALMLA